MVALSSTGLTLHDRGGLSIGGCYKGVILRKTRISVSVPNFILFFMIIGMICHCCVEHTLFDIAYLTLTATYCKR
jgi:hypothetical protein